MTTSLSELDTTNDDLPDTCGCCRATARLTTVQSHTDPLAVVGVCMVCLSIGAWEAQKPRRFTPPDGTPIFLVEDDARTLRAIGHSTNMFLESLNLIGAVVTQQQDRLEQTMQHLAESIAHEGTAVRHKIDVVRENVVVADERARLALEATTKNFDALDTSMRTHLEELDVAVESVASDVAQVSIRGQEIAHMATRHDARLDSMQGKLSNAIHQGQQPRLHQFDGFSERGIESVLTLLKMFDELVDTLGTKTRIPQ